MPHGTNISTCRQLNSLQLINTPADAVVVYGHAKKNQIEF